MNKRYTRDVAVNAGKRTGIAFLLILPIVTGCDSTTRTATIHPAPGFGAPAPQQFAASCGSADLSKLASAIYVSPQGTDGASCGPTTQTACASIQQGINNCGAAGCGVLVRYGRYQTSATITLRDAVGIYGGCVFDGAPATKYRTVIEASPAPGTPAISGASINTATTVHGLVVVGKDETAAGTASIAMALNTSTGVTLNNLVLSSGKGGDGAPGGTPAATAGNTGSNATLAIGTDSWSGTGGSGATACIYDGMSAGAGGGGADYNLINSHGCFLLCTCDHNGGSGGGSGAGGGGNVAGGGGGGVGTDGPICSDGGDNSAGNGGTGGSGAPGACSQQPGAGDSNIWGAFVETGWNPGSAGSGGIGDWGAGGGGGGAGGACTHVDGDDADFFGFPGGGGGSGGCGGPGGLGGQQGGASVGLVLVNSSVTLTPNGYTILSGPGGKGGEGGEGSTGGAGGAGGPDGQAVYYPSITQCTEAVGGGNEGGLGASGGPGGSGGRGGAGGGGAGGNGGPSIGVALVASSPAPPTDGIFANLPGAGGTQGAGGQNPNQCTAAAGANGVQGGSASIMNFELPINSILSAGQELTPGQGIRSPNGNNFLTLQLDSNFCLYVPGGVAVWCTETNADNVQRAIMQTDGNFCLYPASTDFQCSNTAGNPGSYLIVQDSGHIAIISPSGGTLWSAP